MIILRKLFSDKDKIVENKKKGVGGAIGIAAGSAGLGAAGGYGIYRNAKNKINKKVESFNYNEKGDLTRGYYTCSQNIDALKKAIKTSEKIDTAKSALLNHENKEVAELAKNAFKKELSAPERHDIFKRLIDLGDKKNIKEINTFDLGRIEYKKNVDGQGFSGKNTQQLKEALEREKTNLKKVESNIERYGKKAAEKLSKNKKLAIGVAAGTTALGALGAYGYYKNKNKKK